jgi:ABC-2 type transport system permease protein
MLSARTALLVLVVGPSLALVSLQGAIVVSSRVNDPRTAQQFGVLIIIPLAALLVGQFMGALWLSATVLGLIGLAGRLCRRAQSERISRSLSSTERSSAAGSSPILLAIMSCFIVLMMPVTIDGCSRPDSRQALIL